MLRFYPGGMYAKRGLGAATKVMRRELDIGISASLRLTSERRVDVLTCLLALFFFLKVVNNPTLWISCRSLFHMYGVEWQIFPFTGQSGHRQCTGEKIYISSRTDGSRGPCLLAVDTVRKEATVKRVETRNIQTIGYYAAGPAKENHDGIQGNVCICVCRDVGNGTWVGACAGVMHMRYAHWHISTLPNHQLGIVITWSIFRWRPIDLYSMKSGTSSS
jgi:hypothetical protein